MTKKTDEARPRVKRERGGPVIRRRRTYRQPDIPDNTPDESRVCVLTGASGLLGTEFIKRCSLDYKIIAIHHSNDLAPPQNLVDPLYASFPIENPKVISIRADISNPSEVSELCERIIEKYQRVDVLINAACVRDFKHLLTDDSLDQMGMSFAVNVMAPIQLSVEFAKRFWILQPLEDNLNHNRNIINISSTAGTYVYPDSGQAIYSATKTALNYAGFHLANELWDYGVRINTIAPNTFPGIVATQAVLDEILTLDKSTETGQHILIDHP